MAKFSDRVRAAWQVFSGQEKAVSQMVATWEQGQPEYSEVSFESMVRHGWRKNELIYACIQRTANTAAQVGLVTVDDEGDVIDTPLAQLLKRPNPHMTQYDFWSSVILYQMLAGRAAYEKERNRRGEVIALWPLRPDWLNPIKGQGGIVGYEYRPTGMEVVRMRPQDVVDFRLFDPLNMYHGWPPVAVASRVGDVDNSLTDYVKLFFEKGGTPPGLLKTVQKLQDAQVSDIRRRWRERYGGFEHWMEPAVLDSDAEYQKIGLNFDEMGVDILDARDEARICMVFQIPPIIVGAKIGLDRSTYANYQEARKSWWEDVLMGLYANMLDTIESQLAPEFDNVTVQWDFGRVPALQEAQDKLWTRALQALQGGGISVNEFREQVGYDDWGAFGDVVLRGLAVQAIPVGSSVELIAPEPEPEPEAEGMTEDEAEAMDAEDMQDEQAGMSAAPVTRVKAVSKTRRAAMERQVFDAMNEYFDQQRKEIAKNA